MRRGLSVIVNPVHTRACVEFKAVCRGADVSSASLVMFLLVLEDPGKNRGPERGRGGGKTELTDETSAHLRLLGQHRYQRSNKESRQIIRNVTFIQRTIY